MDDKTTTVDQLKALVARFVAERDWRQFHDPKNLSMSIAIEAAELMEHFQWVRSDQLPELLADEQSRQEIEEELADVLAFVVSLANCLEIDLSDALAGKMKKNAEKYPPDDYHGRYRL